jgi:drug/metabolite transporter (DMT)-like permease
MFLFWFSAALVIGSTVGYHLCQKSIPQQANPMLSVIVTFLTAAAASLLLVRFFLTGDSLVQEFRRLNWTSVVLGLSIVGIDVGYLLFYRMGWSLSLGSVFCSALVAIILVPIGVAFFKEKLLLANYVGIVLALAGIYLISRR